MPKASSLYIPTTQISSEVENMVERYSYQRRPFERRWYDNNFFDDGFHFRYLSRTTGKIVDNDGSSGSAPKRAIPKASRQIRGVASLLLQLEPYPGVYPDRVNRTQYPDIEVVDPKTGKPKKDVNPEYLKAMKAAEDRAKNVGFWLDNEWDEHDMDEKLTHMMILTAKHGISFLEIWPDAISEKIESKVFDAFDIYLDGTVSSIYESGSITKAVPMSIDKIKANENFDEVQRERISPDNRYASSEVKQAYMQSRFGSGQETEKQNTLILKETFIKEYITKDNVADVKERAKDSALDGKNYGDVIMRHTFSTSNGWLQDEYLNLPEYPFVDLRFEPGLIYQVPLIERFIPSNKSLDIAVSRVEGFANTMVTGIYQKRKGENFKIANIPGGQVIEYEGTPLTQMQPSSVPAFMFNFIQFLENIIEEQGASTSTLNKLPEGVKSGVAIESVKASEYANLKIPSDMYKKTVKRIAKRLIEQTADLLIDPKEVASEIDDQVSYFDIIGEKGIKARQDAEIAIPEEWVVIKKDMRVRIQIENGLGYTIQGKKDSMQQIANYMVQLAGNGMVSKSQVQVVMKRFLDIFQFGSTAEFMDALNEGDVDMTEDQVDRMKIAVVEVLKDAGVVGDEADQRNIDTTKIGVLEAMKDSGMLNKQDNQTQAKEPSKSISFKDLPPEGRAQLAAQAGIQITPESTIIQETQNATQTRI